MTKKKILILLGVIVLTVNSCVAVAAAGVGAGVGYYCGTTSRCTGKYKYVIIKNKRFRSQSPEYFRRKVRTSQGKGDS